MKLTETEERDLVQPLIERGRRLVDLLSGGADDDSLERFKRAMAALVLFRQALAAAELAFHARDCGTDRLPV